ARLATESPPAESSPDHYVYDPADPTPATGGPFLGRRGAGPQDNRALEARPDVLCYTTPPLQHDVDVIGPVRTELYVRSSLAHTDFFARLCDVEPDGRSINVCDGLFRVEPGKGEPQPDGSLRIEIDMWATAYRFRTGHRLRLQVSSGAHPRWSRNLGTGEPLATGTLLAVAEQAIYHDADHPSALVLPLSSAAPPPRKGD
ncbi:MAG: CocE/NonD family hydrolase, partial [bacterium]|nr:CocE/NonD family hydrolase [bacterium]